MSRIANANPGYNGGPAWAAPADALARARNRRRVGAIMDRLYRGEWFEALVRDEQTQHVFRNLTRHGGKVAPLLEKVNLFRLAVNMHADIMGLNPVTLDVPEAYAAQWERLRVIRAASMWDANFHEGLTFTSMYGAAAFRIDRHTDGLGAASAVISLDDPDDTFALGADGPDGQPTVWERRWFVRRVGADRREVKYLRVQRHRVIAGQGGIVEEEAFKGHGGAACELLADLTKLERVKLADALGADAAAPLKDATPTGAPYPLIVRIANYVWKGEPQSRLPESEIDLLDQTTASLSQLARALSMHAAPKMRVIDAMIDKDTNEVDATMEAILDPHKDVEYIAAQFEFDAMLRFLDRALQFFATAMEITPALLGVEVQSGQAADSYRKLALKSTQTLAAAKRGVLTIKPGLERLWSLASLVDSQLGLAVGGYDAGPVDVTLKPEIPRERIDLIEEEDAMLRAGLTSRIRAMAAVHGEDQADTVYAEWLADQEAESKRQQSALFGAAGFGDPAANDPAPTPAPEPNPDPAPAPAPEGVAA